MEIYYIAFAIVITLVIAGGIIKTQMQNDDLRREVRMLQIRASGLMAEVDSLARENEVLREEDKP